MDEKEGGKESRGGDGRFWWRNESQAVCNRPQLKPGDSCPQCGEGTLVLDGLLMLVCNRCQQIADSGAFT